MIAVITGKLGAGKTYFAVQYIIKKYYKYEDFMLQYVPLEAVRIVTNIRGFKLPHEDLNQLILNDVGMPDLQKMRSVFNADWVAGQKNVIFIIDEAQFYFPRKFYDVPVFTFFQKCRQEGIDVFLITQDIFTMAREFTALIEYEIAALQRAKRSKNIFIYKYLLLAEGKPEVFKTVSLKFRMDIAILYTSFVRKEKEKMTFVYKRYIVVACCALVGALIMLKFAVGSFFGTPPAKRASGGKRPAVAASVGEEKGIEPVSEKEIIDARKKLFGIKEVSKDDNGQGDKNEKTGNEGNTGGDVKGNDEGKEGQAGPVSSLPVGRVEIGSAGIWNGRIISIKYDDPAITLPTEGGSSNDGDGSLQSHSPYGDDYAKVIHGPGLAPQYHGYGGPWVWHPPSEWVRGEDGNELIDWQNRIVGKIRVLSPGAGRSGSSLADTKAAAR